MVSTSARNVRERDEREEASDKSMRKTAEPTSLKVMCVVDCGLRAAQPCF